MIETRAGAFENTGKEVVIPPAGAKVQIIKIYDEEAFKKAVESGEVLLIPYDKEKPEIASEKNDDELGR
ncbi:MAG: hypothetical protein FWC68_05685 [Oscillospiraceae bacterium]|nr:hypothetical protein [Oscillospiraceae bacterium]